MLAIKINIEEYVIIAEARGKLSREIVLWVLLPLQAILGPTDFCL